MKELKLCDILNFQMSSLTAALTLCQPSDGDTNVLLITQGSWSTKSKCQNNIIYTFSFRRCSKTMPWKLVIRLAGIMAGFHSHFPFPQTTNVNILEITCPTNPPGFLEDPIGNSDPDNPFVHAVMFIDKEINDRLHTKSPQHKITPTQNHLRKTAIIFIATGPF